MNQKRAAKVTLTIRPPRLALLPVSEDDARLLQNDQLARDVIHGYQIAQMRISAGVFLEHPTTRSMFLLKVAEGGIIGFVALDWDTHRTSVVVSFIDIAEQMWNRRYGREALEAVMRWATEHGARRLTAEIPDSNDRSKRLFERVGFHRVVVPSRPGAHQRWEWDAATASAERVRAALALHWSSALNHDDVLRDIEPFYRPFANRRSTKARPTSHRLLRLVEAVEADRDAIRAQRATVNLPELIELRHVANTLRSWSTHPLGQKIVTNLSDSNTYAHNIVVLSAYRLLHTWGNAAVELVEEDPLKPTCDLRVIGGTDEVGTEVKVPDELREGRHLTEAEADVVADDAIRSSRKQRQGQPSFVLLVGGFQVPDTSLVLVSSALERHLEKSPTRSNTAGAIALSVGRHPDDIPLTVDRDTPLAGVHAQFAAQLNPALFQLGVAARNAHNARYAGRVQVLRFGEPGVGLHLP
ncbi:MAG: GNAT family N-acetyltransferase [Candidatus Dormibacteraeota bacterium]|nr:GNAT family N-acetyltransferase [Candidatus Dormibacteraeota bacterium]